MTFRVYLPLFALFFALMPACGQSADTGPAPGLPARAGSGALDEPGSAGTVGRGTPTGGAGSALAVVAGANATADDGGVTEDGDVGGAGSLGPIPPSIWNSAKSAAIGDAGLLVAYATWKLAHVETCSNGSWVVVKDDQVASEGIAYGMLLSVAMADQPLFDGLWKYYQDHLDTNGLMNSKTDKCEAPGNNKSNAATDADLDATMALVQAASRWPGATTGYLAKAEALAAKIVQFESDMCDGRQILRPVAAIRAIRASIHRTSPQATTRFSRTTSARRPPPGQR